MKYAVVRKESEESKMQTSKDASAGRGTPAAGDRTRWGAQTPGGLKEMGPQEQLIEGVLPAKGTGLVYAASGACKTFLVLDMSAAIVTGTDWHGHAVKRPGAVVYVATEGYSGLGARLAAWEKQTGLSLADAPLYFIREPVDLLKDAEEFAAYLKENYPDARLIVFDTLSKSTRSGKDQNANTEMAKAVEGAETIARAVGGFALIVHHTTKAGTTSRGGYALDCDTDVRIRLDRTREQGEGDG